MLPEWCRAGGGERFPDNEMPMLRLIAVALIAAIAAAPFSLGARAEMLERDECKALEAEKRALLTPNVKAALTHGPDWVKEHLHSRADIEAVRDYLLVEEKVAFRCRTDGVRIPKPKPPPLPTPKPAVPIFVADQKIIAGAAAVSFLPLRKPSPSAPAPAGAEVMAADGIGDTDAEAEEIATSAETTDQGAEPAPSQAVADSDKTAPSENKATQ